jgi:hypothetical protein
MRHRDIRNAKRFLAAQFVAVLYAGAAFMSLGRICDSAYAQAPAGRVEGTPFNAQGKPPSLDEMRQRTDALIANQHRDDQALEQYERVEHQVDRTGGANARVLEDKTVRIVPTGAGNQKILLIESGKRVDPAAYLQQMRALEEVLRALSNSDDAKSKAALAKREKRQREQAEFVDAAKDAYIPKWLGSSVISGHTCDIFELDPNPSFRPKSILQDAFSHAVAKVWVDQQTNQLVRGEARVISDVSFGGGILGKLYKGGTVTMDQAEVAAGIWLPTRYQYDFAGRKFLFTFEEHQIIEVTHYRRVGPPKEALLIVQDELASGKPFFGDP